MEHLIDVLAHTWNGWPLLGLACVGGLSLAGSFVFVVLTIAGKWGLVGSEETTHEEVILAFDPTSRDVYGFWYESTSTDPVIPFQPRESVH